MQLYDVTATLRPGMPTYDSEPGPELTPLSQIAWGDEANVSLVRLGAHTGTHVDAPLHFLPGGDDVARLALEALVGPAIVLELGQVDAVTGAALEAGNLPAGVERVVLKTRNSALWADARFHTDFAHLTLEGAEWLLRRGVRLVGIDYLSIERYHAPGHPVHHTLLAAGVVIVEGLDLRQVAAGAYHLACLPLKLEGAEGAPARVVLWR
ncbi:MAG: cyclase family protein [Chloroflexi bacterium]|nr:cyclase family protein [Chloroflexota bacterium]